MTERTANTYSKRVTDDGETARSKLTDQNVSIRSLVNYPDPLTPRSQLKTWPQGVTSEMEARWHQMMGESGKRA
ncbi:hypothetical protein FSPOR_10160 [Fusarium sporotrichioides]|uniref:Uncharacterized protein n=1 Tax=Fusarium sporotrichioides TaxID=5514 RepID=A0A395RM65_FUSSP|nr:hypothetical protein FSPOR_10160 [Fusarium sporotrichioides]